MRTKHIYKPTGVCSMSIQYELDENKCVHNLRFIGGCAGNTIGISRLVEGMEAAEAAKRLSGINCGGRGTSCPDQLAKSLAEALKA